MESTMLFGCHSWLSIMLARRGLLRDGAGDKGGKQGQGSENSRDLHAYGLQFAAGAVVRAVTM